jgi:hypothetical protein
MLRLKQLNLGLEKRVSAWRRKLSNIKLYCARSTSLSEAKFWPARRYGHKVLVLRNVQRNPGEGIDYRLSARFGMVAIAPTPSVAGGDGVSLA